VKRLALFFLALSAPLAAQDVPHANDVVQIAGEVSTVLASVWAREIGATGDSVSFVLYCGFAHQRPADNSLGYAIVIDSVREHVAGSGPCPNARALVAFLDGATYLEDDVVRDVLAPILDGHTDLWVTFVVHGLKMEDDGHGRLVPAPDVWGVFRDPRPPRAGPRS
jgi:hypothetical protein